MSMVLAAFASSTWTVTASENTNSLNVFWENDKLQYSADLLKMLLLDPLVTSDPALLADGDITLANGEEYNLETVSGDISFSFILNAGIDGLAKLKLDSGTKTLTGGIIGIGNWEKTGAGHLIIANTAGLTFTGDTIVSGGTLQIADSAIAENGTFNIGAGAVIVNDGGRVFLNIPKNSEFTVGNAITIKGGGSIESEEGKYIFTNGITIEDADTADKAARISITSNKTMTFKGALKGSGYLELTAGGSLWSTYDRAFVLDPENENDNTFNGTIILNADKTYLYCYIKKDKAAANAILDLRGTGEAYVESGRTQYRTPTLFIETSQAVIAGLNGSAAAIVKNQGDNRGLNIAGGGNYAGKFEGSLSILKTTDKTLILTGNSTNFSGTLDVQEGILQFGDGLVMGSVSGSKLQIGENGTVVYKTAEGVDALVSIALWGNGTIRHEGAGIVSLTGDGSNFTGKYVLDPSGTLQFGHTGTSTFAGALSGNGNIVKTGAGTTVLNNFSGDYGNGDVTIEEGMIRLEGGSGANAFGGSGATGVITVKDGASLVFGTGGRYEVNKKVSLLNGSRLFVDDAGVTNLNGGMDVSGKSTIEYQNNKNVYIKGDLSGADSSVLDVLATNKSIWDGARLLSLGGSGDNFHGRINVITQNENANFSMILELAHARAASSATINLQGTAKSPSILQLSTSSTIKGLEGNANSLVRAAGGAHTLTVTGGGVYGGGFDANINLEKSGSDTLILTGASSNYNGSVTVSGGTLQLGDGTTTASFASSTVFTVTGGTLALGANGRMGNQVDVRGGKLLLDKDASSVGDVLLSGTGSFDLAHAGASAGNVSMTGGTFNVTANATLASLNVGGGMAVLSSDGVNVATGMVVLANSGHVRLTESGQLAGGGSFNLGSDQAVLEISKTQDNTLTSRLLGSGTLEINNSSNVRTIYSGTSEDFAGKLKVTQGILALDSRMLNVTAEISDGALLEFKGADSQIARLTGTTGKVSFTNPEATITDNSLFGSYGGTLLMNQGQQVTFAKTGDAGTTLLGSTLRVEFQGGTGVLVIHNATSGSMTESVQDVLLTSSGTIRLTGGDIRLNLNGESWHGDGTGGRTILTLDIGSNSVFVDRTLGERDLDRLYLMVNQDGVLFEGVAILDERTGELKVDVPYELTESSLDDPYQSYKITLNHSDTGGNHILTGNTNVRSLLIESSNSNGIINTGLVLQDGVKLGIRAGRLTIKGNADYSISGGTLGFVYKAPNPNDAEFLIVQESTGKVTVSSVIDDTVHVLHKGGTGELVMSGVLKNTGGIFVESGKMILTGRTEGNGSGLLRNNGELVLGDGTGHYAVNYAGLQSGAGSVTTFSSGASVAAGFTFDNGGQVNLLMGGSVAFNNTFIGGGTTFVGGQTQLTLPQGADQSFTVDSGSSVAFNMDGARDTGKVMMGSGTVYLNNASTGLLDLSGVVIGSNWSRFTGTLAMTGNSPVILSMGLLGDGASIILTAGSELRDTATAGSRRYHLTMGDGASLQVGDGAVYEGTIALGNVGIIKGTGSFVVNSDISGGTLRVAGGDLTLGGNNSHAATEVTSGTRVSGTSARGEVSYAFGHSLTIQEGGWAGVVSGNRVMVDSLGVMRSEGGGAGTLSLGQDSLLVVNDRLELNGSLTGSGTLLLKGSGSISSWIGGAASDFTGTIEVEGGSLVLGGDTDGAKHALLGTGGVIVREGGSLTLGRDVDLVNNRISLYGDSSMTGGGYFGGVLDVYGDSSGQPSMVNGDLNVSSLHLKDTSSKLSISGNLTINDGGSFQLSDNNSQDVFGALVSADGGITLNGVFNLMLDTNHMFANGVDTKSYMLFKAGGGLTVNPPGSNGGQSVYLDLDESMKEFFTLNQDHFQSTGTVSVTRKEMLCYLLDPSYVGEGGKYHDGFVSPNSSSYLGANASNNGTTYPDVFFFDRKYTIATGDYAYRLTNGDAWMNFHVKMTDSQLGAPTKLIIRDNWVSPSSEGGVILSVRGDASDTFTGGTQIFQAKVRVDGVTGVLNGGTGDASGLDGGDVYFFGTGRIEATGEKSVITLNTGGAGSTTEYIFRNDIMLQQGATIEQTSSNNVLAGDLRVMDNAVIRNVSDQVLTLAGRNIAGKTLKIQGGGVDGERNEISFASINGDKVNVKLDLVDVSRNANLSVGRDATAALSSLYLDNGSTVSVTAGGTLAVKEIKSGVNGAGEVYLDEGTFKLLGDFSMVQNGATFFVRGNAAFDTNGYYMEVNQDISGWGDFTVKGGGTMLLNKDVVGFAGAGTIAGDKTVLEIVKDRLLGGEWTVKDGGTLKTGENVKLQGTVNIEAGGYTDFGRGTKLDGAALHFQNGATHSGFLNAEGAEITFKGGSHFLVRTEDLRELTDNTERAMLIAENVTIEDGRGFFRFDGGDGIVNDAIIDSGVTKTLILGESGLIVGGLDGLTTGTSASDLTAGQLASMVGENNYRWLSFELSSSRVGETGSSIDLTVTRHVNFGELARTENEAAIAPVLSYIGMEGGKADSKLQGKELNDLGLALAKASEEGAGTMLNSISLSTSSVMAGYMVQRENLRRHAFDLRDRALQERPGALRRQYEAFENTVWANGLGGTYSVDGDANAVGHTTSLWGGQLGVSRSISDNLVMGLAFTYSSSDISLDQGMGKAVSDAYYIDLFARYHKDNWNLTAVLTGGFTDMDTTRNMAIEGFSSTTKGSSSGNQIMGLVEVGYEFDLSGDRSNIIEPFAVVNFGYSSLDGFTETGAGTAGLTMDSQSMASLSLGAGVRYVKEFHTNSADMLKGRFEVRAMVLQDATDNSVDVQGAFIGAAGQKFTQKSGDVGKTGFLLGAGVVLPITANTSFFADLNGEVRSSETGCSANIGVKYSF